MPYGKENKLPGVTSTWLNFIFNTVTVSLKFGDSPTFRNPSGHDLKVSKLVTGGSLVKSF